jgi:hypothetical protein
MKSDTTTTILNFVLAVLVVLGVVFALMTMKRTGEQRRITPVAMQVNSRVIMVQTLITELNNYNAQARSPELARILTTIQAKPAAH